MAQAQLVVIALSLSLVSSEPMDQALKVLDPGPIGCKYNLADVHVGIFKRLAVKGMSVTMMGPVKLMGEPSVERQHLLFQPSIRLKFTMRYYNLQLYIDRFDGGYEVPSPVNRRLYYYTLIAVDVSVKEGPKCEITVRSVKPEPIRVYAVPMSVCFGEHHTKYSKSSRQYLNNVIGTQIIQMVKEVVKGYLKNYCTDASPQCT